MFNAVVRELAPNAAIFNGPDVRWVGNESGLARETEWSTVGINTLDGLGYSLEASGRTMGKDLGSIDILKQSQYMVWYPAETDVSIRPGWFYHAAEDGKVKSIKQLLDIYYASVGRNSLLLLNLPPDRRGLIHEIDAARLAEFGKIVRETFKTNLAAGSKTTVVGGTTAQTSSLTATGIVFGRRARARPRQQSSSTWAGQKLSTA
jgi:alpha-L-fucosidase